LCPDWASAYQNEFEQLIFLRFCSSADECNESAESNEPCSLGLPFFGLKKFLKSRRITSQSEAGQQHNTSVSTAYEAYKVNISVLTDQHLKDNIDLYASLEHRDIKTCKFHGKKRSNMKPAEMSYTHTSFWPM
jgi:hypothetical protein